MRTVMNQQLSIGSVDPSKVDLDCDSRDDIPAILRGIQKIYCDKPLRLKIFDLIEKNVFQQPDSDDSQTSADGLNPHRGRPGMTLWSVLVLALLKQALNCDFDRLAELATRHESVRQMLGLGAFEKRRFAVRTVTRNVQLLSADLLQQVNRLVAGAGLRLTGWEPGDPLQARCDSFVVETDVEYPTDYRLLRDVLVAMIAVAAALSDQTEAPGWRQQRHWRKQVNKAYQQLRMNYRKTKKRKKQVKQLLRTAGEVLRRVLATRQRLAAAGVSEELLGELDRLAGHGATLRRQVRRRLLQGQVIPQEEKIFSIHADYTRWISKGKAGQPVELGVPLVVVESEQGFVLCWQLLWERTDVEVTLEVVEGAREDWPELQGCSFDKGFSSQKNIEELERVLDEPALPKKGRLSKADRKREGKEWFKKARKRHPAVESAINNLEQRGLDRVREKGKEGFERVVARAILAANVHRIGLLEQRRLLREKREIRARMAVERELAKAA